MVLVKIGKVDPPHGKTDIFKLRHELESSVFNLFQKIRFAIGAMNFKAVGKSPRTEP